MKVEYSCEGADTGQELVGHGSNDDFIHCGGFLSCRREV
jgi:hypothetical protein